MILKMLHKSTWHRLQTSQHRCKNGRLKESQTEWQTTTDELCRSHHLHHAVVQVVDESIPPET